MLAPCVGRGCPCHLAGRSLRASCPALTPRKLATASCLSLACKAGSIARATPTADPLPHTSPGREPGDCGNKGHPAIHCNFRQPRSLPFCRTVAATRPETCMDAAADVKPATPSADSKGPPRRARMITSQTPPSPRRLSFFPAATCRRTARRHCPWAGFLGRRTGRCHQTQPGAGRSPP